MSGLFRRLSSRRSAGPEGDKPQPAAEPGATDAPAQIPPAESALRPLPRARAPAPARKPAATQTPRGAREGAPAPGDAGGEPVASDATPPPSSTSHGGSAPAGDPG